MKFFLLKLINFIKKLYFKISFYFIFSIDIENTIIKLSLKKNYENKYAKSKTTIH